MPKKQKPFKHDTVRPFPVSSAVREAMKLYYLGIAASGKELIPLSQCRLQRSIISLAVQYGVMMIANPNPFGVSSFGKG